MGAAVQAAEFFPTWCWSHPARCDVAVCEPLAWRRADTGHAQARPRRPRVCAPRPRPNLRQRRRARRPRRIVPVTLRAAGTLKLRRSSPIFQCTLRSMIARTGHVRRILGLLARFPVVGLVGARQVGKSTLARQVRTRRRGPATFFDLEPTANSTKFASAAERGSPRATRHKRRSVCTLPESATTCDPPVIGSNGYLQALESAIGPQNEAPVAHADQR